MYADLVEDASFWDKLIEIDLEFLGQAIAEPCPHCGGPVHIANYPRKPRGIPDGIGEAFSIRFSACCGRCRRRRTPWSVRFLGRRVYAGAVVLLATMTALASGAVRRTLDRWTTWWTVELPKTTFWLGMRCRLVPAVPASTLPAGLVERFEAGAGQSERTVLSVLGALMPLTSQTAVRMLAEGASAGGEFTQKMRIDRVLQDPVRSFQAPPLTKT